jgi:hypothetical protein
MVLRTASLHLRSYITCRKLPIKHVRSMHGQLAPYSRFGRRVCRCRRRGVTWRATCERTAAEGRPRSRQGAHFQRTPPDPYEKVKDHGSGGSPASSRPASSRKASSMPAFSRPTSTGKPHLKPASSQASLLEASLLVRRPPRKPASSLEDSLLKASLLEASLPPRG